MYVNAPVLARAADAHALLGFFQTQRTGSRALARWLAKTIGKDRIYFYQFVEQFRHWPHLGGDALAGFRAFAGFSDYAPLALAGRPLAAFSTVRHPLFRLASLYEMSRASPNHVYHALAQRASFEDFYREGSADRPYYFRDLCARRIGGRPCYDAARNAMEETFGAVAAIGELDSFSALLAETCGWDAAPMPESTPDDEKYADYLNSPLAEEILAANREDLDLFSFVIGAGEAREREYLAAIAAPRAHPPCPLCGDSMTTLKPPDYCPGCNMPPRVRSLPRLMDEMIKPWLAEHDRTYLPLLAFAATGAEQNVLRATYPKVESVSLYGGYGAGHRTGVDVRDLSRFAEASFGGAMSILLFDYFPEHERALAELSRVLAPGAAFFTLILQGRLTDGMDPPAVVRRIEPKPGYFDYIPEGEELLSVRVGRAWFVGAMERAGFDALAVRIEDPATGQMLEWFVGFKREADQRLSLRGRATDSPPIHIDGVAHGGGHVREYLRDVDPGFGFTRIALTLRIPQVPQEGRVCHFGEHVLGRRTVIGVGVGRVLLSENLGESWRSFAPSGGEDAPFQMCFTTASGCHLLQTTASEASDAGAAARPEIFRYAPDWTLTGRAIVGHHNWHGRAAIGEAGGTIMWAEYPDNKAKYLPGREAEALPARVWRSRDDGASWEQVFEQPGSAIRHFHTIQPDPYVSRQWWLSSGDRPHECRVWIGRDDGDSWIEATNFAPDGSALHPRLRGTQAVQRFTDMAIGEDALIWGSDDWLGGPANIDEDSAPPGRRRGSRMFRSPRTLPLEPESIGWIGNPIRSLVDIGPALLALTEAKREALPEPQVYLVAKDRPLVQQLFTIDVAEGVATGFTYSRASARAEDGHFFSFRGLRDLAKLSPRLLHWHVAFD